MTPRRGDTFIHRHQLRRIPGVPAQDWPHDTCTVTRVTQTAVYFRNSSGFLSRVDRDRFPTVITEEG